MSCRWLCGLYSDYSILLKNTAGAALLSTTPVATIIPKLSTCFNTPAAALPKHCAMLLRLVTLTKSSASSTLVSIRTLLTMTLALPCTLVCCCALLPPCFLVSQSSSSYFLPPDSCLQWTRGNCSLLAQVRRSKQGRSLGWHSIVRRHQTRTSEYCSGFVFSLLGLGILLCSHLQNSCSLFATLAAVKLWNQVCATTCFDAKYLSTC